MTISKKIFTVSNIKNDNNKIMITIRITTFLTQSIRDKALQNFHTLKIREINKIIRELWQLIYKGQVDEFFVIKFVYLFIYYFSSVYD